MRRGKQRLLALRELLKTVSAERPLWCVSPQQTLSAGDLSVLLRTTRAIEEEMRGRSVAVFARDSADLAKLLLILDGVCGQITLLPESSDTKPKDTELLQSIVQDSQSEIVLSATGSPMAEQLRARQIDLGAPLTSSGQPGDFDADPTIRTRWLLPTSGTTGRPKLVAHSLRSLTRSVKSDLDSGSRFVWGSLYSLSSFAGLQVFLQSWCGGSKLVLGSDNTSLAEQLDELIAGECNALSATPSMWRMLLMQPRIKDLKLQQITLGGETVDQRVLDVLRETFSKAKITQIYASTEAGVGFTVRDGRSGFPASFLDDPPHGVRLKVDEHDRLWLGHTNAEPDCTDPGSDFQEDEDLIDTGDIVQRECDRFEFRGRASGVINVGGKKVHPQEVEAALMRCPDVQLARVLARPSPLVGSLVEAEVVTAAPAHDRREGLEASIIRHCRQYLDPYKVPAIVRIVESFELTPSGKVVRNAK